MKHAHSLPANRRALLGAVLIALAAGPVFAETDIPKILVLPDNSDTVLPGDHEGAKHGVVVRRGSGFPEPVVIEAPEPSTIVEARPARPRVTVRRRSRGW